MVAQAYPVDETHSIKLLDLLTNRYHLGVIREWSDAGLQVELPATSRFHAGQRVHFAVAEEQALISKSAMQRGFVTQVFSEGGRMAIQLAVMGEAAVA